MNRASLAILLALAAPLSAQTSAPTTRPDDAPLYFELIRRDQPRLLARALDNNAEPAARRGLFEALAKLPELARLAPTLPTAERQSRVAQVAGAIAPDAIDAIDAPRDLLDVADRLYAAGVAPEVNTLEYWGASPATQARLRPVVALRIALLDRAVERLRSAAQKVAEAALPNDAGAIAKLDSFEAMLNAARQQRALADYQLALALDEKDPKRAEAADAAIAFLNDYDRPSNPAQLDVKLILGKLQLARLPALADDEKRDAIDAATTLLDAIVDAPVAPADPAAAARAFQARFERALVELAAGRVDDAQKRLDALREWRKTSGLADASVRTAEQLLEYRILARRDDADSRRRAVALLATLIDDRPELSALILAQLEASVPPDAAMASLGPLELRALVSAAQDHLTAREATPALPKDAAKLQRGLDAARELIARGEPTTRPAGGAIDPRAIASARFLIGACLEALDRPDDAAVAFFDCASKLAAAPDQAPLARAALSNAQRLFAQRGGLESTSAEVAALYDKILPLAVAPPFEQKELNFDWAVRLQQLGRPAEAIGFFRAVPESDPRHAAARALLLVALAQQPDAGDEALKLGDEVIAQTRAALAEKPDDAALRQRLARSTIVAADVARRVDPKRAVALLANVEASIDKLPDADALLRSARVIRVQSLMRLGQTKPAVDELVKLLEASGAGGSQIVFDVLSQLEREYDAAEARGDRATMATLQAGRAALTPYLVSWARGSDDPAIRASLYRYEVYDAETQRLAATFAGDPGERDRLRKLARERFESLDAPDGRKRFDAARDAGGPRTDYDPQVMLGLARLAFDEGKTADARDRFARLLNDRALGTAVASVRDAGGGERQVDNDAYWETLLRYVRCALDAGEPRGPLRQLLAEQKVRYGDRAGGGKWRGEFDAISKELDVAGLLK